MPTLLDALERGFRMEKIAVHCNMCGMKHMKWSLTLHDELQSIHPTQADALDRLVLLCSTP